MVWNTENMTQFSFKGHRGIASLRWLDWNSSINTVDWEVAAGAGQLLAWRGEQASYGQFPWGGQVSAPSSVASFMTGPTGHLLEGSTSVHSVAMASALGINSPLFYASMVVDVFPHLVCWWQQGVSWQLWQWSGWCRFDQQLDSNQSYQNTGPYWGYLHEGSRLSPWHATMIFFHDWLQGGDL